MADCVLCAKHCDRKSSCPFCGRKPMCVRCTCPCHEQRRAALAHAEEELRKASDRPLGERGAAVLAALRQRPCQTGAELARAAAGVFPMGAVYATLQRLERQKRVERRRGLGAPFYVATTAGLKALTIFEFHLSTDEAPRPERYEALVVELRDE